MAERGRAGCARCGHERGEHTELACEKGWLAGRPCGCPKFEEADARILTRDEAAEGAPRVTYTGARQRIGDSDPPSFIVPYRQSEPRLSREIVRGILAEAMGNAARNPDTWSAWLDFVTDKMCSWFPPGFLESGDTRPLPEPAAPGSEEEAQAAEFGAHVLGEYRRIYGTWLSAQRLQEFCDVLGIPNTGALRQAYGPREQKS